MKLPFVLLLCLSWKLWSRCGAEDANGAPKEEPTTEQQQAAGERGPEITPTTWVLSATTHMPKPLDNALAKDFSKQANYVHWTCYRHKSATGASAKLPCCREIYQAMERDPFQLCWRKSGCQQDKVGRSEFMHYCVEQLVSLHLTEDEVSSNQSIQPRFSLLAAPQLTEIPSDQWRQYVSFVPGQGGHWVYLVESPYRLAMDPATFFSSSSSHDEPSATNAASAPSLDAVLSSMVLLDEEEDEDFRDLSETLTIALPEETTQNGWSISLEILLYLPEAVGLRKGRNVPACTSTAGSCQVELKNVQPSLDQQSIVRTTISLSDVPSSGTLVLWTYSLALDDDNLLLPSPVIFSAAARHSDGPVVLDWVPKPLEKLALSTSLDEISSRDEL
jgi:hypothetical protein